MKSIVAVSVLLAILLHTTAQTKEKRAIFEKLRTGMILAKFLSKMDELDEMSIECFANLYWNVSGVEDGLPEPGQKRSDIFKEVVSKILTEIHTNSNHYRKLEDGFEICINTRKTGRSLYDEGNEDYYNRYFGENVRKKWKNRPLWVYGDAILRV